jgi:hypothetical protein
MTQPTVRAASQQMSGQIVLPAAQPDELTGVTGDAGLRYPAVLLDQPAEQGAVAAFDVLGGDWRQPAGRPRRHQPTNLN